VRTLIGLVALAVCAVVLYAKWKERQAILLLNEGTALHNEGKVAESLAKYEKAVEICPRYQPAHDMLNEGLAEAAEHFTQSNEYDKVAEALEKLLKRKPDHPTVHYDLGYAYWRLKKADEATQHLQEQLKRDPNHAVAQRLLTSIQRGETQRGKARGKNPSPQPPE
jgi:superkiller protein 3